MKKTSFLILFALLLIGSACGADGSNNRTAGMLVLRGGTILDLSAYGQSRQDILNSIIIIRGGKIEKVGIEGEIRIPEEARVIDVSGKYIVPGLIDGFGIINNQNYADAYLFHGVTTVACIEGRKRGSMDVRPNPSPEVYPIIPYHAVHWKPGAPKISPNISSWSGAEEIERAIDSIARMGTRVVHLSYGIKPFQLPAIVKACKKHDLPISAELGRTSYRQAAEAGVNGFVHSSRYSADVAPDQLREMYGKSPFKGGQRVWDYYARFNPSEDDKVQEHAEVLGRSEVGLLPTFSFVYPVFPDSENPWDSPVAEKINPSSVHMPLLQETGKWSKKAGIHDWDTSFFDKRAVLNRLKMDSMYAAEGAKYLIGTGADAFGTLPGVSVHCEMEMLQRVGLTNRQILAAGTTNFSRLYGWAHIGRIKPGCEADILVLGKNPLKQLKNLKAIDVLISNGTIIDRSLLTENP